MFVKRDLLSINDKNKRFITKEMVKRFLFGFRYPKIAFLVLCIILAYILFSNPNVEHFVSQFENIGYLGIFIAGIFVTLGFTAPFAVGFLIIANPQNIWLASLVGALGAVTSDLLIFKLIKFSFMDEFLRIEHIKPLKAFGKLINLELGNKLENFILYIIAGIVIASPLPDEIGVIMLAGLTKMKSMFFAKISFILHLIGIFVLLKM